MRAVLASHNKKKMKEMREILAQLGVEVISQAEEFAAFRSSIFSASRRPSAFLFSFSPSGES